MSEEKPKNTIDLDAEPSVFDDLEVWPEDQLCSAVKGQFEFDPSKIVLHLSEDQKGKKRKIRGNKLRKELEGQPVLSANVLAFLLKKGNQHLIPESWKKKKVFFWGTIYRTSDGRFFIRYLLWSEGKWCWGERGLGRNWGTTYVAAISAT